MTGQSTANYKIGLIGAGRGGVPRAHASGASQRRCGGRPGRVRRQGRLLREASNRRSGGRGPHGGSVCVAGNTAGLRRRRVQHQGIPEGVQAGGGRRDRRHRAHQPVREQRADGHPRLQPGSPLRGQASGGPRHGLGIRRPSGRERFPGTSGRNSERSPSSTRTHPCPDAHRAPLSRTRASAGPDSRER